MTTKGGKRGQKPYKLMNLLAERTRERERLKQERDEAQEQAEEWKAAYDVMTRKWQEQQEMLRPWKRLEKERDEARDGIEKMRFRLNQTVQQRDEARALLRELPHYEHCDVHDQMSGEKPCNCPLKRIRACLGEDNDQ